MDRIVAAVACTFLVASAVISSVRAESTVSADTDAVSRAACAAGRAYASRDLATLDWLTARDYVQTDVRGTVLNRAEWMDFVRNRQSTLSIKCEDVAVRFYGPVAVATGAWTYTNHRATDNVVTQSRWTSVWTKENGDWKRHVFQNTYVNPDADQCAMEPQN
jgi:ketosteroid isomerase-like protein